MCQHKPPCPTADQPDREAVQPQARGDVMGWTLLCNGTIDFDDRGGILPNGSVIASHRPVGLTGAAE
ncbi:DUF5999 family protein [Streptomyces sp. NPDC050439]|uniref:DUF5999 family protein n=1 Tax=unclassified Streptomyces TaxID=2593676 RepID=UPI003439A308